MRFLTMLLMLTACSERQLCQSVLVDTTQHTNAAVLSWSTTAPSTATVTYTVPDEEPTTRSTAQARTSHNLTLFGLPPLADIDYTLDVDIEGRALSCEGSFTTGNLSPALPRFTVTVYDEARTSPQRYLVGVVMEAEHAWPLILDRTGRWRWHRSGMELSTQAEVSADGRGILLNSYALSRSQDEGRLIKVNLLNERLKTARMENGHHSFAQLPDAFAAYLAIDVRDWSDPDSADPDSGPLVPVVGDAIMELGDDDEPTPIFSTWDWQDPTKHDSWDESFYPQGRDWTHANALKYIEQTDTYLMSLGNMDTVLEIDRSSGSVLRQFPSEDNPLSADSSSFTFQHDPSWTDTGNLLLLSHGEAGSAALEYEIEADGTLQQVWSYGEDQNIHGELLGQAIRLEGGNTLVNFGGAGLLQEVTAEGDVVWELSTGLGSWMGNVQLIDDIYDAAVP